MHGMEYSFFISLMNCIRSRSLNFYPNNPKYFDMNSVAIICPIVDFINHSFTVKYKIKNYLKSSKFY